MEFEYNKDWETRDKLIFGKADKSKYMGGCRSFSGLNYRTLCTLLEEKFIDLTRLRTVRQQRKRLCLS